MIVQEKEQIRSAWDRLAAGYDAFVTPTSNQTLAEHALRLAGVRPGMRLLDVASGSGALSIPAARMGAHVLALDISPAMIDHLKQRARAQGLSNLQASVMDGQALELEDGQFDIAASQFGVMLFPDMPRGVREMARVTKAGGQALIIAFGPPSQVEFLRFFLGALRSVIPGFAGLPTDPPPLPFQLADPQALRHRMADAGLQQLRVEPGTHQIEVGSGQELWDWVVNSNPIGAQLVAGLSREQGTAVLQALDAMLHERMAHNGTAILHNPVNIGLGVKP